MLKQEKVQIYLEVHWETTIPHYFQLKQICLQRESGDANYWPQILILPLPLQHAVTPGKSLLYSPVLFFFFWEEQKYILTNTACIPLGRTKNC